MKKLGPISLPQDYPGGMQGYNHRLSVMLYQYLREMSAQINTLIDASGSGGGGGGGGIDGHVIQDESVTLAQRATLNFTGAGVSVTDSGSKTVVTIDGGGGGGGGGSGNSYFPGGW